jgi:hypothetical protein
MNRLFYPSSGDKKISVANFLDHGQELRLKRQRCVSSASGLTSKSVLVLHIEAGASISLASERISILVSVYATGV